MSMIRYLAKTSFANTLTISHSDNRLTIKPRYIPLIPSFIVRGIVLAIALGIISVSLYDIVTNLRGGEELIVIVLFLFLGFYTLWIIVRSSRKILAKLMPKVIFDGNTQTLILGNASPISFATLSALQIETLSTAKNNADFVTVRFNVMSHGEQYPMYIADIDKHNLERDTRKILSELLSTIRGSRRATPDDLLQVDWDAVMTKRGHISTIQLNP